MKGCSANNFVSNPNFSAFANASSVVPILEHSFRNFLNSVFSLKFLQIGWSVEMAIKLAPKIVSGLVVNILIFFLRSSILKSNSQPIDLPIQFFA